MQLDEQRLRFRDAMASLSAAVNIITTEATPDNAGLRQRLLLGHGYTTVADGVH